MTTTKQTTIKYDVIGDTTTGTLIDPKNTIDRKTGERVEGIICSIFYNSYGYHLTTQVGFNKRSRRYKTYPTFGEAIVAANRWAERLSIVPGASE